MAQRSAAYEFIDFDEKESLDCPYEFTSRCTMGRCEEEVLEILRSFYKSFDLIKNTPQTNTIPLWFEHNFKKK
jgi:hypothetical protein